VALPARELKRSKIRDTILSYVEGRGSIGDVQKVDLSQFKANAPDAVTLDLSGVRLTNAQLSEVVAILEKNTVVSTVILASCGLGESARRPTDPLLFGCRSGRSRTLAVRTAAPSRSECMWPCD
jgi:hypothetical protein